MDWDKLPRGQLGWTRFVESLAGVDDRVERHFLEMKSELDLASKNGGAKVAKFVLGAANRDPVRAATRFEGHALMVIGIKDGVAVGFSAFEAQDLERAVQRFLGADGPRWDFERVPVNDSNDVIIVVVNPPQPGDPMWTSHADGPDLRDGGIYIRVDGATREAKGNEVRVLIDRSKGARPPASLEVTVVGAAVPYVVDDAVLDEFVARSRDDLGDPGDSPRAVTGWGGLLHSELGTDRETRTAQEFRAEVDAWEAETRDAWSTFTDRAVSSACDGVVIRVRNLSTRFLEGVRVTVRLTGDLWAVDWEDGDAAEDVRDELPALPRVWGNLPAKVQDFLRSTYLPPPPVSAFAPNRYGIVEFDKHDDGSVTMTVDFEELRPDATETSNEDDVVLFAVPDLGGTTVAGTWTATVRGHDALYEGDLDLAVVAQHDLSDDFRQILAAEDG